MDIETARFLVRPEGARLLDAARETRDLPAHRRPRALAATARPELIRAALQQDDLRRHAASRVPHAERLLFTGAALEQATAWSVAEDRARRWPAWIDSPLVDLGAGIGLDTLATALAGRRVRAFEVDPVRACLLRHNVDTLGVGPLVDVVAEDALEARPSGGLAFLDPGRRPGGVRTRDARLFEPPRETWEGLLAPFGTGMLKLPPAAPGDEDTLAGAPWVVVSLDGRARERRVCLGDFRMEAPRTALSLPSGRQASGEGRPWPVSRAPREGDWLLDPDPAVTLAGLVGDVATDHGLAPVHPRIAYLLGSQAAPQVPGRWVRIEALLRPRAREIRAWLDAGDVGRLTIRTRGVADDAATWRHRIGPRSGSGAATLVFTRGPDDRWLALGGREHETDLNAGTA